MSLGESLLGADAGYQQMGGPQAAPRLPRRASMGVATAGEVIAAVEADEGQCPQSMLQTDPHHGLSHGEAAKRLRDYGPNALPEEKVNPCLVFLGHFWGPMPIMIWVAIAVEFALATINNEPVGYLDAGILLVLQLLNGLVGWHEGQKAGDAIAALKGALSPKCSVVREGKEVMGFDATQLVPGDIVKLCFGQAVPADCRVLGDREIRVDQAALTGESMPKRMIPGDVAKMGSTLTEGEVEAVVVATGCHTFFGKTASLINKASNEEGHFQKLLMKITIVLISMASVIVVALFAYILSKRAPHETFMEVFLKAISICVVVLISSIPIVMQVVCLTALAVGAKRLAEKKAIVKRLGAIEELAVSPPPSLPPIPPRAPPLVPIPIIPPSLRPSFLSCIYAFIDAVCPYVR